MARPTRTARSGSSSWDNRGPEDRHHVVADVLVHGAAVANDLLLRAVAAPGRRSTSRPRGPCARRSPCSREVGEQHRCLAALLRQSAGPGRAPRRRADARELAAEQPSALSGRGRLGRYAGRGGGLRRRPGRGRHHARSAGPKRRPALDAELRPGRVLGTAGRTARGQRRPARHAEASPLGVFRAAARASSSGHVTNDTDSREALCEIRHSSSPSVAGAVRLRYPGASDTCPTKKEPRIDPHPSPRRDSGARLRPSCRRGGVRRRRR